MFVDIFGVIGFIFVSSCSLSASNSIPRDGQRGFCSYGELFGSQVISHDWSLWLQVALVDLGFGKRLRSHIISGVWDEQL